ncbi:MAG: hypothetical protein ABI488_04225 [Polyangiaceae bacterium]
MNDSLLEHGERERVRLRNAIVEVAVQVSTLSAQHTAQVADLVSSWTQLLPLIEPAPEPPRRDCPHCQRRILVSASRCMFCLKKSAAPAAR